MAEVDRHKTARRDRGGRFFEFTGASYGQTVLPALYMQIVERVLGKSHRNVLSWPDGILICSYTWWEHLATVADVFLKLSKARPSEKLAKGPFASFNQEFFGIIVDVRGMRPAPSKIKVITNIPAPTNVEQPRSLLGLTG